MNKLYINKKLLAIYAKLSAGSTRRKSVCFFWRSRTRMFVPLCAGLLMLVCNPAPGQQAKELVYTDAQKLMLIGKGFGNREDIYSRLPEGMKGKVREAVWELGRNSAGLAVRFRSNSSCIGARWTLLNNFSMAHMAGTGIRGLDLYVLDEKGNWKFVGTAQPNGKESANVFVRRMDAQEKEFLMYLPLYDGVTKLEVGVDSTAFLGMPQQEILAAGLSGLEKGIRIAGEGGQRNNKEGRERGGAGREKGREREGRANKNKKPLVFYGTSITQGGCVSRPGMAYPAIVSRKLQVESVNLGFSGNGRMDGVLADSIAQIDAGAYIVDCLPNCTQQIVKDSTEYFIKTIALSHPGVPVYMVSNPPFPYIQVDARDKKDLEEENALWYGLYKKLKKEGCSNLRYINIYDGKYGDLLGTDGEETVDGVHLTDLGAMRLAEILCKELSR